MNIIVDIISSLTITILGGIILALYKDNRNLRLSRKNAHIEKEKNEAKRQENRDSLLLGVARVLLCNRMQEAIERGETTQSEYEIIDELYKPYVQTGGNGVVKHLFEDRYKNLKVK